MSFGFSIGDFIRVLELANKLRARFHRAPEEFEAISDDIQSLSIILCDIQAVLPHGDLTSEQRRELSVILVGCHNVLSMLHKILQKYQELGTNANDSRAQGFRLKLRGVWKRLKWEPEDINDLRMRIISNITLLNVFYSRLSNHLSLATKTGVDLLSQRLDDQEHQSIIAWITPADYSTQQNDFFSRRQEGTGEWLLQSSELQEWVNESKKTLICSGIPGAGKTMITSIVIEHLSSKFRDNASVGIAYIYCNFRRQQEQKPADLLASLLKQLVRANPSMPKSMKDLYEYHKKRGTRPALEEISRVLRPVVANYSKVFIIIDAMDECQVSGGDRRIFLSEMFSLQAKTGVSLFITSRLISEIVKQFEGSALLTIRANDGDVQKYLDNHISQLPQFVLRNPDLQEEIKTEIIKAVDGMFLLAQLHLDSLIGKMSPKAVRNALKKLPRGSKAYDHAYEEAIERIESQVAESRELAKQVLSWIICAKRPLSTSELQHALAVETGESDLDKDNLPEVEDIVSVCAGLVIVDKESDIIRLVHYTAQEYFERKQRDLLPNIETDITRTCITYLSFDTFALGFCQRDEDFEARLRSYVFYEYAATNWGYHARAASTVVEQLLLDFLESETKAHASSQAMMVSRGYPGYSQRVPRQMAGLHLAAYFGLRNAVIALMQNGHDLGLVNTYGGTPLSLATENGHEAVVKLLLAKDANPNFKDKYGRTPLSLAARNGFEAVVALLLGKDSVDLNAKDTFYGWTPMSLAARHGREGVVILLLEKDGIDQNSKDLGGRTPLSLAAENGHETVMKLLLQKDGIELDPKDKYGRTPLSWAAKKGHVAVVRLLLAKDGIDQNSKDLGGRTPLSLAAENGHETVMKLLLQKDGIELDSKDKYGRTPLSWAAKKGHTAVVRLLLAKEGIDLNSKDTKYALTPLSWAVECRHRAIVELLFAKVVDSNCKCDGYIESIC